MVFQSIIITHGTSVGSETRINQQQHKARDPCRAELSSRSAARKPSGGVCTRGWANEMCFCFFTTVRCVQGHEDDWMFTCTWCVVLCSETKERVCCQFRRSFSIPVRRDGSRQLRVLFSRERRRGGNVSIYVRMLPPCLAAVEVNVRKVGNKCYRFKTIPGQRWSQNSRWDHCVNFSAVQQ